jgi:hypothetical protein
MKYLCTRLRLSNNLLVSALASTVGMFLIEHKFQRQAHASRIPWNLFDSIEVIVLSGRLASLSRVFLYLICLPLWLPSIPIAHRKLVI